MLWMSTSSDKIFFIFNDVDITTYTSCFEFNNCFPFFENSIISPVALMNVSFSEALSFFNLLFFLLMTELMFASQTHYCTGANVAHAAEGTDLKHIVFHLDILGCAPANFACKSLQNDNR